jgi:hypothetical protein
LGSFMGYDQTWGFHWPGWPLIRSVLLPLISWHPYVEFLILCSFWLVASWLLSDLVKKTSHAVLSRWVFVLSLMAPGYLVSLQSYRPEIITGFALVVCLWSWHSSKTFAKVLKFLTLLLLPLLHPVGFVLPVIWIVSEFLLLCRHIGVFSSFKKSLGPGLCFSVGVFCFFAWYARDSVTWMQFQTNLKTQRLLTQGMGSGYWDVLRWGYGFKGALPLILILGGGVLGSAFALHQDLRRKPGQGEISAVSMAALAFLSALAFNLITKNPNTNHLLAVTPFAVWLYAIAANAMLQHHFLRLRGYALATTLLVCNVLVIKNSCLLWKKGGVSYRGTLHNALSQLPKESKVLIPVVFWEAAILLGKEKHERRYAFSTFPNIMTQADREQYEQMVLDELEPGDLLIWDPLQEKGGVFNFVTATALRHRLIQPESQFGAWEHLSDIHIPVQYSRGQSVYFQLYRKK